MVLELEKLEKTALAVRRKKSSREETKQTWFKNQRLSAQTLKDTNV